MTLDDWRKIRHELQTLSGFSLGTSNSIVVMTEFGERTLAVSGDDLARSWPHLRAEGVRSYPDVSTHRAVALIIANLVDEYTGSRDNIDSRPLRLRGRQITQG